mmetsp:Transcript_1855/g.5910  ORF Transcript_1855/g.5910 Transcript_1855/m.5910 type:complete len:234 (-) Transcript_1855:2613-3314(-)
MRACVFYNRRWAFQKLSFLLSPSWSASPLDFFFLQLMLLMPPSLFCFSNEMASSCMSAVLCNVNRRTSESSSASMICRFFASIANEAVSGSAMSTFSRLPSLPLRIILNAMDCAANAGGGDFPTFGPEGIAVVCCLFSSFLFTLTLPTPKNFSISRSNSDSSWRDATTVFIRTSTSCSSDDDDSEDSEDEKLTLLSSDDDTLSSSSSSSSSSLSSSSSSSSSSSDESPDIDEA